MHQTWTRKPLKTSKWRKRGTCTPDQGSGATLGVLGYTNLTYCGKNKFQNVRPYSNVITAELNKQIKVKTYIIPWITNNMKRKPNLTCTRQRLVIECLTTDYKLKSHYTLCTSNPFPNPLVCASKIVIYANLGSSQITLFIARV